MSENADEIKGLRRLARSGGDGDQSAGQIRKALQRETLNEPCNSASAETDRRPFPFETEVPVSFG